MQIMNFTIHKGLNIIQLTVQLTDCCERKTQYSSLEEKKKWQTLNVKQMLDM